MEAGVVFQKAAGNRMCLRILTPSTAPACPRPLADEGQSVGLRAKLDLSQAAAPGPGRARPRATTALVPWGCITRDPHISRSQTMNTDLTASQAGSLGTAYPSPLTQGLSQAGREVPAGAALIPSFDPQLTHTAAGEIQFLTNCWTHGLGSSLAVGWRCPSVLGYVGPSIWQLATWQLAFLRASERVRKASIREARVFVM